MIIIIIIIVIIVIMIILIINWVMVCASLLCLPTQIFVNSPPPPAFYLSEL